ncbi:unnamed protein product [Darwinula stevensoni]|uniref:Uncharacterized protein n=1 Tax=Darwinula stevensoni TaxID=69355 RepID=A0A7R8XC05_9CRUS|nr:unnamed protein product [Darwinula stevensoni]CAG0891507.1 unnamed protein product [Darwinula stevensoni]
MGVSLTQSYHSHNPFGMEVGRGGGDGTSRPALLRAPSLRWVLERTRGTLGLLISCFASRSASQIQDEFSPTLFYGSMTVYVIALPILAMLRAPSRQESSRLEGRILEEHLIPSPSLRVIRLFNLIRSELGFFFRHVTSPLQPSLRMLGGVVLTVSTFTTIHIPVLAECISFKHGLVRDHVLETRAICRGVQETRVWSKVKTFCTAPVSRSSFCDIMDRTLSYDTAVFRFSKNLKTDRGLETEFLTTKMNFGRTNSAVPSILLEALGSSPAAATLRLLA